MKTCGACGRKSPSLKRALVFAHEAPPEIKLACRRCRLRALPAITPPPVTVPNLCNCCRQEVALVGQKCVESLHQNVQELTRANLLLQRKVQEQAFDLNAARMLATTLTKQPVAHVTGVHDEVIVEVEVDGDAGLARDQVLAELLDAGKVPS